LIEAQKGDAFILQVGDCAEDFSRCNGPSIHDQLKVILKMAIILTYAGEKKVIKVGRIAGQYAKPRSSETEVVDGCMIPSYRGDMVNNSLPIKEERIPNPARMLEGYFRAAATLNLIRAFTGGGYAALDKLNSWSNASFGLFPYNEKYDALVLGIQKSLKFIQALGINITDLKANETVVYTSHEALLLEYEEAMTRIDTTTGKWYDTSAHMLWIGDRTRNSKGAHAEFLSGVCNPIGIKIGPNYSLDDVKQIIFKLNPTNESGRISLITRFGADKISIFLRPLIQEINKEGFNVVWLCDPMHGNTYLNSSQQKTRNVNSIKEELKLFWDIHRELGTMVGGVHLELTGDNVTECVGGEHNLSDEDLIANYTTTCDPRLNAEQSVELAFFISELLKK
jgi:3-deoxy-7-phosphoheptulonate synthase